MHLKRLEIRGFKSFSDKVSIDFEDGITAVVGPNGSGKSNIVDAIRWVLGEQSAKTLRGTKMDDIIFSGTEIRKPLGSAEVSLIIDNNDNYLPLEYSEIIITRRLYRSGESEYLINNTSSRLKDILELFMDTGIGKDGYSLIGQGKIEEIISTRPEDRRNVFEEAAGIVKYKSRRQEAEKKLQNTKQNLVRITDIISELENQITPLEGQAKTAKKYLAFRDELKELEINVILYYYNQSKDKLDKINNSVSELSKSKDELEARKDDKLKLLSDLKEKLKLIEEQFARENNLIFENEKKIESGEGNINLLNERLNNCQNDINRLKKEIDLENNTINEIVNKIKSNQDKKNILLDEIKMLKDKIISIQSKYEDVSSIVREQEEKVECYKSDVIQTMKDIADINNKVNSSKIMIDNLNKRKEHLLADKSNKLDKISFIESEIQSINSSLSSLLASFDKLTDNECKEKEKYQYMKSKLNDSRIDRNKTYESLKINEAKFKTLNEMEKSMDGFSRGVKAIIKNKMDNKTVLGTVRDIIEVPSGFEVAVETALGGALQNIVVDNEYTAQNLIKYLKTNNIGRATFYPLNIIKGHAAAIGENVTSTDGFIGIASNIVKYSPSFKRIVENLLGRIIICSDIEKATVISKKIQYAYKIVTLDGDVINTGGSFTGGSRNVMSSGIITRKNELKELTEKVKVQTENLKNIDIKINESESAILKTEYNISQITKKIQDISYDIKTEKNKIDMLVSNKKEFDDDVKSIELEVNQITRDIDSYNELVVNLMKKLDELNNTNKVVENEIVLLQLKYKDSQDNREKLSQELTENKILLAEKSKVLENINDVIGNLNKEKNNREKRILELSNDVEDNLIRIKETQDGIELIKESINSIRSLLIDNKSKIDTLDCVKNDLQNKISISEGESDGINKDITDIFYSIHKFEISKSKIEAEIDMHTNKLWEDYELTIPTALKYKKDIQNYSEASKKVNELKNAIKELGDVNVTAIEEFKKVTERYNFLKLQRTDLENAESSLTDVIMDINEKMQEQFKKGFKIIRDNFNWTFKELFNGGHADLKLENEDVLNCGIEIIVQPPGKKLQSLSLLSGGERGLAAIALIFAILKMKPTPFCVLDEIEAALDDANVNRFAKFLKIYSNNTQFIVITHRKGSMAVADALYGVTMEEKGVSKLLSLKLQGGN